MAPQMWRQGFRIIPSTQFSVYNTEAACSKLDTFFYCEPLKADVRIRSTLEKNAALCESKQLINNGRLYLLPSVTKQPLNSTNILYIKNYSPITSKFDPRTQKPGVPERNYVELWAVQALDGL